MEMENPLVNQLLESILTGLSPYLGDYYLKLIANAIEQDDDNETLNEYAMPKASQMLIERLESQLKDYEKFIQPIYATALEEYRYCYDWFNGLKWYKKLIYRIRVWVLNLRIFRNKGGF